MRLLKNKITIKLILSSFFLFVVIIYSNNSSSSEKIYKLKNESDVIKLAKIAKNQSALSPWHFNNLYDPPSKSFFIPYHLWSGAKWDGIKSTENCIHKVNTVWNYTNPRDKQVKSKIIGQQKYTDPKTGQTFKTFEWKSKRGSQYLICHKKGLARIYDFRFEKEGLLDSPILNGTECKFPAGFGWQIGESQDCNPNAPKQTTVTELIFDKNFKLIKMIYIYTRKKGFSAKLADDIYEYVVDKGRVSHKKIK